MVASRPPISGICMSMRTRSKDWFSRASSAAVPVADDDLVSSLFQEPNRQELIHGVVFGHEHPQAPLRLPQ